MMRHHKLVGKHMAVCGHIFKLKELEVGSQWVAADGGSGIVTITAIEGDDVTYTRKDIVHTKNWFNFQCRYCLKID